MKANARKHYDRFAPYLVLLIGIFAAIGIWIGVLAGVANARQDEANSDLLDCLNRYAGVNADVSAKIRDAAVAKDVQLSKFHVALNDEGIAFESLVNDLYAGTLENQSDLVPLKQSLHRRSDAAAALLKAQENLDQVRVDNPIPDPPRIFCDISSEE